jgi:sensor domain CHASE-containing protein
MKILLFIWTISLLAACGGAGDEAAQAKLFQDQRAMLEKAKGVEADLQKEAQKNQQAIEKQTQ